MTSSPSTGQNNMSSPGSRQGPPVDLENLLECQVCSTFVDHSALQCQVGHLVCLTCRPQLLCCIAYRRTVGSDTEHGDNGPVKVDESCKTDEDTDLTTEESDSEDWNSSEESETDAMLDVHESRFLTLLDQRVSDTEKLFDNLDFIFRNVGLRQSTSPQVSTHPSQSTPVAKSMVDSGTQTEFDDTTKNHVRTPPVLGSPTDSNCNLSAAEKAREEIVHLRAARDSLLNQRQELALKIKQSLEVDTNDERKLFEYEEAIGGIDACIDFKNEIICGREFVWGFSSDTSETSLMTRLTSLTMLDLQRLLCTLYTKIVELRYSTKILDKQAEENEIKNVQANRRCTKYKLKLKQLDEEYNASVEDVIRYYCKDQTRADQTRTLGEHLHHAKTAKAARRKQYDLELCLTELLVRHDYLRNEGDYDVKHVVDMLGIDPLKLQLHQMEDDDEERKPVIPAALRLPLANANPMGEGIGMSRRMREAYGHRRQHHTSSRHESGHDSHRQGHGGHDLSHGHGHGHTQPSTSASVHHHRTYHRNGHTSEHPPTSSKYKHKS